METNSNTIHISDEARDAIKVLQHNDGTYPYYRGTLDRLFNTVLHASEDLGMDYMEAMATLRALDCMRQDLAAIAGRHHHTTESTEETAGKIEDMFTDIDDIQDSNYPKPEGE